MSLDELLDETDLGRTTMQNAISRLLEQGLLRAVGRGVRGDPRRYRRPEVAGDDPADGPARASSPGAAASRYRRWPRPAVSSNPPRLSFRPSPYLPQTSSQDGSVRRPETRPRRPRMRLQDNTDRVASCS